MTPFKRKKKKNKKKKKKKNQAPQPDSLDPRKLVRNLTYAKDVARIGAQC